MARDVASLVAWSTSSRTLTKLGYGIRLYHSSLNGQVPGMPVVDTSRLLIVSTVPSRLGPWLKKFAPPSRPS